MNIWFNEVIDAHIAIEQWLGNGLGDVDALLARFSTDYSMIALSGAKLDYAALSTLFKNGGGARAGLQIKVDKLQLLEEWPQGAAVLYRETQMLPDTAPTLRWSTVIFRMQGDKLLWRHLQETDLRA